MNSVLVTVVGLKTSGYYMDIFVIISKMLVFKRPAPEKNAHALFAN